MKVFNTLTKEKVDYVLPSNVMSGKHASVIIENNNNDVGLLIKTIEPKVRGVAVSCEGGDNTKVQQQIFSTIEALLDIKTSNISISKLSYTED